MFDRKLGKFREWVLGRRYLMTLHAEEEMDEEDLSVYDVEAALLTGRILERQKDQVTAEWKYRIRGSSLGGEEVEVVVKESPTERLVVITVYRP